VRSLGGSRRAAATAGGCGRPKLRARRAGPNVFPSVLKQGENPSAPPPPASPVTLSQQTRRGAPGAAGSGAAGRGLPRAVGPAAARGLPAGARGFAWEGGSENPPTLLSRERLSFPFHRKRGCLLLRFASRGAKTGPEMSGFPMERRCWFFKGELRSRNSWKPQINPGLSESSVSLLIITLLGFSQRLYFHSDNRYRCIL